MKLRARPSPRQLTSLVTVASLMLGCAGAAEAVPARAPDKQQEAAFDTSVTGASAQLFRVDTKRSAAKISAQSFLGSHPLDGSALSGCVRYSPAEPERSTVQLDVDLRPLRASPAALTDVVKGPKLLDVARFPKSSFRSAHVWVEGDPNSYQVRGTLKLHGVSHTETIAVSLRPRDNELDAQAEFTLLRTDYDLIYRGWLEPFIEDEIKVSLSVVLVPAPGGCTPESGTD